MNLTAVLCWWNERPDWLTDVIRSLPLAGVNRLVAVDGSYEQFPGGTPGSSDEQTVAVLTAAVDAGIGCDLYQPPKMWPTEPAKRSHAFRLADRHEPDWLLVIDADEVILDAPLDLHDRLEQTDRDVADVCSLDAPSTVLAAGFLDNEEAMPSVMLSRCVMPRRCLFRWTPGITVGPRHFDYVTQDGRNLWGDHYGQPLRVRDMVIDHRNALRDGERTGAARAYYGLRDTTGIEGEPVAVEWTEERAQARQARAAELDKKLASMLERA